MLVTVNFQWEQGGYLGSWYHSVLGLVWLNGSNGGACYPVLSPFTYKLPLRSFAPGDHLSDVLGWTIIRQPCSHCIFFFYSWQSFFFQSNPNIYWRSVILPFSFLWVSVTLCCVPLILFFVCALFPYISFLPCCPKWDLHFSFLLTMLWFIFPLQIGITILIFTSECFCSIFFETNISFPAIDNLPFIFRNSRLILIWTVMLFIVSEFKVGNLTYANLVTLAVIIKFWFL